MKKFVIRCTAALLAVIMSTSYAAASAPLAEVAKDVEITQQEQPKWEPEQQEETLNTKGDLSIEELKTATLPAWDVPEVISEAEAEANGHVNRLYEQEDDLNTVIFQNRDGTKTMYYFSDAVKYVDKDGNTVDKDNSLTDQIGNAEYEEEYGYTNRANDIKTYFPKTLEDEKGVVLEDTNGGIRLEMAPESSGTKPLLEKEQSEKAVIAEKLTTSEIAVAAKESAVKIIEKSADESEADKVSYNRVFGAKTEIQYAALDRGFKEDILLKQRTDVNRYSFILKTGGLTLLQQDEAYVLVDPLTGEKKASLGEIEVYDSKETRDYLDEAKYSHHYEIETIAEDSEYRITIVVDPEYLQSEDTVYPVTVDPSITASSAKDTTIFMGNDGKNNSFGSSGSLYVGNYTNRYGSPDYGRGRVMIDFPLLTSNNTFMSLDTSKITSAKLWLRDIQCESDAVTVKCFEMMSNWSESATYSASLWASCGAVAMDSKSVFSDNGANGAGNSESSTSGYWYGFDVQDYITKVHNKGVCDNYYGFMLRTTSTSSPAKTFASSEYTNSTYRPRLKIDYFVPVSYIGLFSYPSELDVGESTTLCYKIEPANASNNNVTITSSNPCVVSVSGDTITGISPGTAKITLEAADGQGAKQSFGVTVFDSDPWGWKDLQSIKTLYYDKSAVGDDAVPISLTVVYTPKGIFTQDFSGFGNGNWHQINDELKNLLNNTYASPIGATAGLYMAVKSAREEVARHIINGLIVKESAEYYGLWAAYAYRIMNYQNIISQSVIEMANTVTFAYSVYYTATEILQTKASRNKTTTTSAESFKSTKNNVESLFDELDANGTKFTREKTKWITRGTNGKIVWLETGSEEKSGYLHMTRGERLSQFKTKFGISTAEEINSLVYDAVTNKKPIGVVGNRYYYTAMSKSGELEEFSVAISDNGYIITAIPDDFN